MLSVLISLLVILIIAALFYYVIVTILGLFPIPEPIKTLIILLLVVIVVVAVIYTILPLAHMPGLLR